MMSEIKESKIKNIISTKEYVGQHGTTYYFTVELENGEKGQIGKKKADALKVGQLLKYFSEVRNGFVTFKEPRENNFKGGGYRPSTAAIALQAAAQITSANITASGKALQMDGNLSKRVTDLASQFNAWLKSEESK